jgi:hypothetical protein
MKGSAPNETAMTAIHLAVESAVHMARLPAAQWAIAAGLTVLVAACNKGTATSPSQGTSSGGSSSGCSYTVGDGPSGQVPPSGGEFTVSITTAPGCTWSVSSSAVFITTMGTATGTGPGSVRFNVLSNGGAERTGSVQVAGRTLTITQGGLPAQTCAFTVSPTDSTIEAAGGDVTVTVTAASGLNCPWTATSSAPFITVKSGSSGTGSGTAVLTLANNAGGARAGQATVAGQTVTVLQASSSPTGCAFSVMPLQTSIPANGGNVVVTVTNTAGAACAWIAISQSPSLSVSGPSSGNGSGIATFVVQPNGSTTARTLKATVAGQPIQIDQAGAAVACAFAISPSSAHVPKAGATLTVSVQVTQGIACSWTASSFQPWMVVTSGSSGTGNGTVTVYVEPNTGPARLSSVTIAGKPFNVNQDDGQTCGFSVTPLTISVPAGQTFTKVTVNNTQGINCPWSAVPSAPWVYFLGSQTLTGAGTDTFDVFTALNTGAARTATIDIAGYVINVSQAATALPSNAATVISFQSDPGDYVGGGQSQTLTFIGPQQFNAQFNAAQGSFSFATLVAVEPSFSLNMLAPPGQSSRAWLLQWGSGIRSRSVF